MTESIARHRFNNDLRYRSDDHEMQRQLTPPYVLEPGLRARADRISQTSDPSSPTTGSGTTPVTAAGPPTRRLRWGAEPTDPPPAAEQSRPADGFGDA